MISWKQRAKKDRGRFCSSSREETQDRLLSLFRCFLFAVSYSLFLLSLFLFYFVFFRLFL